MLVQRFSSLAFGSVRTKLNQFSGIVEKQEKYINFYPRKTV